MNRTNNFFAAVSANSMKHGLQNKTELIFTLDTDMANKVNLITARLWLWGNLFIDNFWI